MTTRPDDETKYTPKAPGAFERGPNNLQHWVKEGGDFPPASGRYHVFINYGCGWSHQVMLARAAKGLQNVVSMSHTGLKLLGARRTPEYRGWSLPEDPTGNGFASAYDVYNSNLDYGQAQLTVPILFDKESKRVVSNDPAHILLMLNSSFDAWAERKEDFYPVDWQEEIERWNGIIFPGINDGVYRCWFGGTDEAYKEGFDGLQSALAVVEKQLASSPYLCGEKLTLADLRAFPHLFRFDVIYHELMLREPRGPMLADTCPAIVTWLKRLFEDAERGLQATCDLEVATRFYMQGPSSKLTQDDCDKRHAEFKYSWMPSAEELVAKRATEGVHPDCFVK
mmetsp:Transcript_11228/g.29973  ORF Transcript_11228/g.29973 Transcript_11228/m.29973 type:complete len:338 (-) Transcript_11228:60-1073(-)|eukprot:CAMPEP_0177328242 /NCGR_PEP_ID=MMETSP0368-20130122/19322_1 /TAXON_ID=447022 ORGANISM="Scrippsiella hangoei-like, Strain SHHI-4" /NCGR_SAMPLE_ID=MMETSP0368 /ASSEMBLY_ACC=CAM_ASM_000363 /LENGTH=337 /DNA_ID=CAMNT_0018788363 /DNA_START=57 /DNA_END=1070 /DNA_ORIENTATION=-